MAPVHGKMSAAPVAPPPDLKVFRPQSNCAALGVAVNHLMTKPAFADLRFGECSRMLVGQVHRGRCCLAADSGNQIQGFNDFVALHLGRQAGGAYRQLEEAMHR
ncbi:MAG TPA: hypothetical protein VH496_11060 [Mycobacterium sp.]